MKELNLTTNKFTANQPKSFKSEFIIALGYLTYNLNVNPTSDFTKNVPGRCTKFLVAS